MSSRPKTDLSGRKVPEKIQRGYNIVDSIDGNPHFPSPTPTLDEVRAILGELEQAYQDSLYGDRAKKGLMFFYAKNLDTALNGLCGYVDGASKGDPIKILSSGFELRNIPSASRPVAIPLAPVVKPGMREGEVQLNWNPVADARSYMVQISHDNGETWEDGGHYTRSCIVISGLPADTKPWFRIAAFGTLGQSNWSENGTGKVAL